MMIDFVGSMDIHSSFLPSIRLSVDSTLDLSRVVRSMFGIYRHTIERVFLAVVDHQNDNHGDHMVLVGYYHGILDHGVVVHCVLDALGVLVVLYVHGVLDVHDVRDVVGDLHGTHDHLDVLCFFQHHTLNVPSFFLLAMRSQRHFLHGRYKSVSQALSSFSSFLVLDEYVLVLLARLVPAPFPSIGYIALHSVVFLPSEGYVLPSQSCWSGT